MINKYYKIIIFIIAAVCISLFYSHKAGDAEQRSITSACAYNDLIKEKCEACHDLKRICYGRMSAERWFYTVKRMRDKKPGWLSEEQLAQVVSCLTANNMIDRKFLFEKKCIECHSRIGKKAKLSLVKTKQGWQRAIERMRKKYWMFIGMDDAAEAVTYWTDPVNNHNLDLYPGERDRLEGVFEDKCGACHSYKLLYRQRHDISDWKKLLAGMRQKSPAILKESDLRDIQDYLLQSKALLVK